MTAIELPIIGQGSQPHEEDGAALEYMSLPETMNTYSMPDVAGDLTHENLRPARELLQQLLAYLNDFNKNASSKTLDLTTLDTQNTEFINQFIGEGEVSIVYSSDNNVRIQESVLAGVWRLQTLNADNHILQDRLEVALIPVMLLELTFKNASKKIAVDPNAVPQGVMNALPLLAELDGKIAAHQPNAQAHIINLSLLPQTEADLEFLQQSLGKGTVTILSRGYGNCRISSTSVENVWWVQYFNSEDSLILNTLEVTDIPSVACAAVEDIEDSRERLHEMLEVYL